jgi:hypothetical protein
METRRSVFAETNIAGDELARVEFEYALPRAFSISTALLLPVLSTREGIFIGLEYRELPAVQKQTGSAAITVVPALRLPRAIRTLGEAKIFAREGLKREFGLEAKTFTALGGRYYPTVGITPEVVYPFAVEVDARGEHELIWVELGDAVSHARAIQDAHSLIAIMRLFHAAQRPASKTNL